ncbi:unnamed protein product [Meganyctiphanes norvegica]|uniref:SGNH hydrolase-type esterase domain-containing protein n=1 Tax=Meganyctiphanes norvegica TaxID=48144 RepID=A0AAV2QXU8_MEGNR
MDNYNSNNKEFEHKPNIKSEKMLKEENGKEFQIGLFIEHKLKIKIDYMLKEEEKIEYLALHNCAKPVKREELPEVKHKPSDVDCDHTMITLTHAGDKEYVKLNEEDVNIIIKSDPTYQVNLYCGDMEVQINNEHAISNLLEVVNQNPDNVNAMLNLATAYFRLGNNIEALKYNNLVLITQPKNICAIINKGTIFASEGDLLSALEIFQNAVNDDPHNTTAKVYYEQTLNEFAQRLIEEEAIQINQKNLFTNPSDSQCKEALSKIPCERQEIISIFNDKNNKEINYSSTDKGNTGIQTESRNESNDLVNIPSLKFKNIDEDIITTHSEMLEELNNSLIEENLTPDIKKNEKITCDTKENVNMEYITSNCETESEVSCFITQNPRQEKIRLAIIGDSHALRYPRYLFSKQFCPYLLKYQPFILDLNGNSTIDSKQLDKILSLCEKPEAAIIIMGGNDVASTMGKDHHILCGLMQIAETLQCHDIQPIIVPIMPRRTTVHIPPAVYNIRAFRINVSLQKALSRNLNFDPFIDYIYHVPKLKCDGVHLTRADYIYLTNKIMDHYLKTNYRSHKQG